MIFLLQKVPTVSPPATEKRVFLRLVRDCLHARIALTLAVLGFVVLGAGRLALTWLVKIWVEGPIVTHDPAEVRRVLFWAAGLTAVMFVALSASRWLLAAVNQRLLERLRGRAAARLFEVELSAVRRLPAGEWISRVFSDAGALAGFVENVVKRVLGDGLVAVGAVAMMFWLDARLALAVAALLPFVAILLSVLGRAIRRWAGVAQKEAGTATARWNEQLHGMATIKGFQAEEREAARFRDALEEFRRKALRAEGWASLLIGTVFLATGLGLIGVVAYGTSQVIGGRITQGALLAFSLFAVQAIEPMRRLAEVHGLIQKALAAAERVYQTIDLAPLEPKGGRPLPAPFRGELVFERVSFGYRDSNPVVDGVSFRVGPGEALALVSGSGGGKTTLARLLLRFEQPRQGRILVDGVPIAELDLAHLRRAVCVLEQDVFLFSGSVAENLRFGRPQAAREALEEAAEAVGLAPLLSSLPRGLDSPLDEAARNVSGGEKQRLALARAILRDPPILVLDESFSALDAESEGAILDRIASWLSRRTVLVMAHRLSTVMRMPRAALLENGHLTAVGAPEDLLSNHGAFGRLFADQVDLLLPERAP
jgi:subfamily B ATP-binding cassette protein MsbA